MPKSSKSWAVKFNDETSALIVQSELARLGLRSNITEEGRLWAIHAVSALAASEMSKIIKRLELETV